MVETGVELKPSLPPASALLQLVSPLHTPLLAPPETDWTALLALAEEHGLAPLLYTRLETALHALPDATQAALHRAYMTNAAQAMLFEHELSQVIALFRAEDVPLVAFKGVPLAKTLYGDAAVRPTVDVDVMVREADLDRSRALLEQAGWTANSLWQIHYNFVKEVGGAEVLFELHWTSQREGEYPIPPERFWEEAREGPNGWAFSHEMTLLILVLHTVRHQFEPYRQLVDIAHAVALWNETLDWQRLVALADEADALPMVATVLALVHRDLGAPLPRHDALLREIGSKRVWLTTRYLSPAHLLGKRWFPVLDRYLAPVLSGASQPARLFLRDFVRPPEQLAYIYGLEPGSRLVPLFYVLRPFLLAGKYLRRIVERR
jgi:hypothetical protein